MILFDHHFLRKPCARYVCTRRQIIFIIIRSLDTLDRQTAWGRRTDDIEVVSSVVAFFSCNYNCHKLLMWLYRWTPMSNVTCVYVLQWGFPERIVKGY
jgi:hypothetical protein